VPDRVLAVAHHRYIHFWDIEKKKKIFAIDNWQRTTAIEPIDTSADNCLYAVGTTKNVVHIYNLKKPRRRPVAKLQNPRSTTSILSLTHHYHNQLMVTLDLGNYYVWDLEHTDMFNFEGTMADSVHCTTNLEDGRVAMGSWNGEIHFCDLRSNTTTTSTMHSTYNGVTEKKIAKQRVIGTGSRKISAVVALQGGFQVASRDECHGVYLIDLRKPKIPFLMQARSDEYSFECKALAQLPDGTLATSHYSNDSIVRWEDGDNLTFFKKFRP